MERYVYQKRGTEFARQHHCDSLTPIRSSHFSGSLKMSGHACLIAGTSESHMTVVVAPVVFYDYSRSRLNGHPFWRRFATRRSSSSQSLASLCEPRFCSVWSVLHNGRIITKDPLARPFCLCGSLNTDSEPNSPQEYHVHLLTALPTINRRHSASIQRLDLFGFVTILTPFSAPRS